jgi:hypothetical protein
MATTDKNTIGVTPKAQKILDQMSEDRVFADQMDAAKLAMSVAIRRRAKPGEVAGAGTKWNVGSFDPEGYLRQLMPILFPDNHTPYRVVESLIDSGLEIIARHYLKEGSFDLVPLLKDLNEKPSK